MKKPKTTVVSLRILPALLVSIDTHAAIEGVNRGKIIRCALEAYYEKAN